VLFGQNRIHVSPLAIGNNEYYYLCGEYKLTKFIIAYRHRSKNKCSEKEVRDFAAILARRSTPYVGFLVKLLGYTNNEPHTKKVEQEDDGDIEQELYEIDDEVELYKNNEIEHKNVVMVME
ncbi:5851_t:CDS:2, partial [Racocetra persica]